MDFSTELFSREEHKRNHIVDAAPRAGRWGSGVPRQAASWRESLLLHFPPQGNSIDTQLLTLQGNQDAEVKGILLMVYKSEKTNQDAALKSCTLTTSKLFLFSLPTAF